MNVSVIRRLFRHGLEHGHIAEDGNIEIVNASFIADEPSIFGTINDDWNNRELEWYVSESLKVTDIKPPVPAIWNQIASSNGEINSNYGWCVFSGENGKQYKKAIEALKINHMSRQAVMIYIRPTMHEDAKRDGMRDFMCTYSVQLLIRGSVLHYIVNMRSSDAVFGYKGDYAWHDYVMKKAVSELSSYYPSLEQGLMHWNAGSLHIYPRHFHLITS